MQPFGIGGRGGGGGGGVGWVTRKINDSNELGGGALDEYWVHAPACDWVPS